jgi:hypothetical protein
MNYLCNCFKVRPKKKSRVHSFHEKKQILLHTPLYNHIVRHNGNIAKGATVMYGNGKTEVFTKDQPIYIADLAEIEADANWGESLDNLHYVMNFIDFKQCIEENKQCFIISEMYGKEMFLRNIYMVKEPGCWGSKYE